MYRFANVRPALLLACPLLTSMQSVGEVLRPPSSGPLPGFTEIWNSGDDLNNLRACTAGDFDSDGLGDLLGTRFGGNRLVVYETDGDDSFQLVTQPLVAVNGPFTAVATGDSDMDGQREILGGVGGTANKIILLEAVSDNQYVRRFINVEEPDINGPSTLGEIGIADLDQDGRPEIIFNTSESPTVGAVIYIYEHDGVVGENNYTKVFTFPMSSHLHDWCVGDSDNDGVPELVMCLNRLQGAPLRIGRLESSANDTFTYKEFQTPDFASPSVVVVADVDNDGLNEIVFGAGITGVGSGVMVYESPADDTYELDFAAPVAGASNTHSIAASPDGCNSQVSFATGYFSGHVSFWTYTGAGYAELPGSPVQTGGAVRAMAIGLLDTDARLDVVVSSGAPMDRLTVFEIDQESGVGTPYCSTSPNSAGAGASMGMSGTTSIAANDFVIEAGGAPPTELSLFFYGPARVLAPFGDGFRCVGKATRRLQPLAHTDAAGFTSHHVDFTTHPASSGASQITPGSSWNFQLWFRDPGGAGGSGFNLSDGLSVEFCP